MWTRIVTVALLGMLVLAAFDSPSVFAQTDSKESRFRAKVNKYGVEKNVSVKLKDSTGFKGKISSLGSDGFSVTDKNGIERTFAYSEVDSVKGSSSKKWIMIAAVAGGAFLVYVVTVGRACSTDGNIFCQ